MLHRLEKLEIKDALTGLYNEAFIRVRLGEEIKRAIAYQRPCALIIFDVDSFKNFYDSFGLLSAELILKKIATLIGDSVSDIDRVGRVGNDEFAIILPEKNKRRAQEIADEVRKKIEFSFSEETDAKKRITVSAGVSENPLDGIDSDSLVNAAKEMVKLAKEKGRNMVMAFKEPPVCQ